MSRRFLIKLKNFVLFCFVTEVTSQRCRRAPNKEARSIPRASVSCVLMHNCYYEYHTSCCKHIILECPIRHLTQINILNMQTQGEAMLPEAVSLYCRSVNATVPWLRSMGVITWKCHRWRCRLVHRTDGFCWLSTNPSRHTAVTGCLSSISRTFLTPTSQ